MNKLHPSAVLYAGSRSFPQLAACELFVGVRIHDVRHPLWRDELEIIISRAGQRVAKIVLPKPEFADDVPPVLVYMKCCVRSVCFAHKSG